MTDDGFSSEIRARCRAHWPELVKAGARRWGMKEGEYIRRALAERLERDGFNVGPKPTFASGVFAGGVFDVGGGK